MTLKFKNEDELVKYLVGKIPCVIHEDIVIEKCNENMKKVLESEYGSRFCCCCKKEICKK